MANNKDSADIDKMVIKFLVHIVVKFIKKQRVVNNQKLKEVFDTTSNKSDDYNNYTDQIPP